MSDDTGGLIERLRKPSGIGEPMNHAAMLEAANELERLYTNAAGRNGVYRKAATYRAWRVNRAEETPRWFTKKLGPLPDTVPEGRWLVMQPDGQISQWSDDVFKRLFVPQPQESE